MAYYRDLLPRMAASGWDLRLQYEAKANVRAEQIALLAEAGVCAVQYGIESLSSRVLKLMDKAFPERSGEADSVVWHVDQGSVRDVHVATLSGAGRNSTTASNAARRDARRRASNTGRPTTSRAAAVVRPRGMS